MGGVKGDGKRVMDFSPALVPLVSSCPEVIIFEEIGHSTAEPRGVDTPGVF